MASNRRTNCADICRKPPFRDETSPSPYWRGRNACPFTLKRPKHTYCVYKVGLLDDCMVDFLSKIRWLAAVSAIGAASCKQIDLDSAASMSREAVVLARLKQLPSSSCPSLASVTNGLVMTHSRRGGVRYGYAYKITESRQLIVVLDEKAHKQTNATIDKLWHGVVNTNLVTKKGVFRADQRNDQPVRYCAIVSQDGNILFEKKFGRSQNNDSGE